MTVLIYTLAHYFYPRHSNNHKARLLHLSSLFLVLFSLLSYQLTLSLFPATGVKILGYAANIAPAEVISLTNQKRIEAGLSTLNYNSSLEAAARKKGEHMLANDYWSHTAPDGTEPWAFFIAEGYKYKYAGENLARDFTNPNSAVEAWMASPGHKENILSTKYTEIGIAVVEGDLAGVDSTLIVQLFGTRLGDTATQVPVAQAQIAASPTATVKPSPTSAPIETPTPEEAQPVVVAQITPTIIIEDFGALAVPAEEKANDTQLLFSPFDTTRSISLATIILLLIVLAVDGFVVARKRLARLGGRTFAHMAFLGMIVALILIAKAGEIL